MFFDQVRYVEPDEHILGLLINSSVEVDDDVDSSDKNLRRDQDNDCYCG